MRKYVALKDAQRQYQCEIMLLVIKDNYNSKVAFDDKK